MKKLILLAILLLIIPISLAKTEKINLYPGMSRLIENSNITLISLDEKNNKAIVCINNEKKILTEDSDKTVGKLIINAKNIKLDYVEFELKSDCKDCVCTSDCSNALCFPEVKQEIKEENKTEIANPASVYCESHSGKSEIRTLEDGSQTGYCIFPNKKECEEWAYYRGDCKQETETPKQKTFLDKIISFFKSLF